MNQRIETWLARAEEMLHFAETAKSRFEIGDWSQKREVLAHLGSNLILKDQKLTISLREPLQLMQEVAPEVQALHNRFEPLKSKAPQEVMEGLYSKNKKWGG